MKNNHRLLTYVLLASSAVLLVIIICAHQFRWGIHFPVQKVTPEEMVGILKTSNVVFVSSTNSSDIWVQTKLGFRYHAPIWKPKSGSDYDNTTEPVGLIIQILEKERGLEQGKDYILYNRTYSSPPNI